MNLAFEKQWFLILITQRRVWAGVLRRRYFTASQIKCLPCEASKWQMFDVICYLLNNSYKGFRIYCTDRKHTVKASWENCDNNLNDPIRHRQTGRFPWDW